MISSERYRSDLRCIRLNFVQDSILITCTLKKVIVLILFCTRLNPNHLHCIFFFKSIIIGDSLLAIQQKKYSSCLRYVNPLMPNGVFNICCPRDCVSRHQGRRWGGVDMVYLSPPTLKEGGTVDIIC